VLNPGDSAPSMVLQDLENRQVDLSETWNLGSNALLVFLRHLG